MRLLIKQRVFALTDTYDVYDEDGNPKYFVRMNCFPFSIGFMSGTKMGMR